MTQKRTTDKQPPAGRLLNLKLSEIDEYAHNPRRSLNPEYDRLKASIRVGGMDQPLVVTRRPGEQHHTVAAGGNSRLRILKELHADGHLSSDSISCVEKPWISEGEVLVAHLRENDLRGALTFIDKAAAVLDARTMFSGDAENRITQGELSKLLATHGYHLSQAMISQMEFAVDFLWPLIPVALEAGMSRRPVEQIRILERAARVIWCAQGVDTEAEFDNVFEALCRRYDSPEWDIDLLRRGLEAEMAERADIDIQTVSMAIHQFISGRADPGAPHWVEEEWPSEEAFPNAPANTKSKTAQNERPASTAHLTDAESDQDPSFSDEIDLELEPARADFETDLPDLKSLRARAWTLASRLAQRNGIGELVEALPKQGLGFILTDVPDPGLVEALDRDALARVSMVWWHLAACAEITVAPVEQLAPLLGDGSVLKRALVDQDAGLLFSSVWTLDPGHVGYRLWRHLDARDWSDLLGLMDTYRALYRVAASTEQALWS